jgi:hypothetical protein
MKCINFYHEFLKSNSTHESLLPCVIFFLEPREWYSLLCIQISNSLVIHFDLCGHVVNSNYFFSPASNGVFATIESTACTGPLSSSHIALYTSLCRCIMVFPVNISDVQTICICEKVTTNEPLMQLLAIH